MLSNSAYPRHALPGPSYRRSAAEQGSHLSAAAGATRGTRKAPFSGPNGGRGERPLLHTAYSRKPHDERQPADSYDAVASANRLGNVHHDTAGS